MTSEPNREPEPTQTTNEPDPIGPAATEHTQTTPGEVTNWQGERVANLPHDG